MEVVKQKLGPMQKAWLYDLSRIPAEQQGQGRLMTILKDGDKPQYCCLGVAEHLTFGKEPVFQREGCNSHQTGYFTNGSAVECATATTHVANALRLFDECGTINPKVRLLNDSPDVTFAWRALTTANDEGKTFAEIVARIEEYPHYYFSEPA